MAKARKEFNVKYKDKMEEEKNVADAVSSVRLNPKEAEVDHS